MRVYNHVSIVKIIFFSILTGVSITKNLNVTQSKKIVTDYKREKLEMKKWLLMPLRIYII